MKLRVLLPLTAAALAFAACDKANQQQAQQLAEERAALEREKGDLAAQKAAAQQAANDQERARLESERAALEMEKAKLSDNREAMAAAEKNVQLAAERERRLAAERKAADEAAGRQAAEIRAREAQMTIEQAHATPEDAGQPLVTQTVGFFYDALDPYGDWVQTDRYGYAFRPNTARDPHWRPYTDGDWVHTDYGWTWRSEEPFGWATYHYGRWARAPRLGWVWVPGSEWGPAWVSWRRSDDYVGWAPLPPDAWSSNGFNAAVEHYYDIGPGLYVFLHTADFGEHSYRGRVVEPEQNVTIINQTVNVTKVSYQNVQNKMTVVNNGPDLTFIDRASRVPVQRATVQRMTSGAPQPTRLQGNVLQLSAPVFNASKPTTKPKSVKGEVNAAELDRGWRDAKQDEQKLRDSAKQAALRAEESERAPTKKFVAPLAETPAVKPARVIAPEPPERPLRPLPATPRSVVAATPLPEVAPPISAAPPRHPATPRPRATPPTLEDAPTVPAATPLRAATPPPPLRPRMTPPVADRRAITPPPAQTTGSEIPPPAAERTSVKPRGPAVAATPEPTLNPARVRPGALQPAAPLRKFLKPTPAPAGEPIPPPAPDKAN